ncbi:hypothetical protein NQ318_004915 [Aromia moschata]|uniref:Transmembrane protein 186 n=1 Tax=Aromia moschata TaxID=1265417 RepID=A0AAV8Z0D1_9CUCU|nr:hypothetical protein NQ318_004915 [Aromia moschata]
MTRVAVLLRGLPKILQNCRSISIFANKYKQSNKTRETFTPVYKFPYIVPFSIINRLKIYQTGLTTAGIPAMVILNQLNYVASDAIYFTAILGISGCLTLYSLGFLTERFVGFIYYNEEKDIVKIAYIDFWGRRKDIEVPGEDIVPLNELPIAPMDVLFLTLRRFSTKETLRLNLRFGIILDKNKFKKMF